MNISVSKDSAESRFFIRFKSPFGVILIAAALILLFGFLLQVSKYIHDQYYPYAGKVIRIEKQWFDMVIFDSSEYEHLIIETADGDIIDRYTDTQQKILSRVEPGDHVVKEQGFREKVKVIGKKTIPEMIKETEELIKN